MEGATEDMQQFAKGKPVDVLIVGAGPTGLMAAVTLARYGLSFRLIDQRSQPVARGQAAGYQPRTAEIMHSLGFHHTLTKHANVFTETSFWLGTKDGLHRWKNSPEKETIHGTPYPGVTALHQGHTEAMFIKDLASRGIFVDRPVEYIDHVIVEGDEYPLRAHLKDWNSGVTEEILTKYIVGCDGARSAVRHHLAVTSSTRHSSDTWAVADVYVKTNFPDIRRRSNIRTEHGSALVIPIADNWTRIYTLLTQDEDETLLQSKYDGAGEKRTNNHTIIGLLTKRLKSILKPYEIEITKVDWVSRYMVAQRITNTFAEQRDRVFILGDACHTHSPKAAQGMNVSMNDAYNLTWKLALTIRGIATPALLKTYEIERRHIAKQLIEFDEKYSHLFASPEYFEGSRLQDMHVQNKGFMSGCGHRYPASLLTDEHVDIDIVQEAVEPLTPGKRLLPIQLIRHNEGRVINSLDDMPSNGHFRILVFAGTRLQTGALDGLSTYLSSKESPLTRYSTAFDSTITAPGSRTSKAQDTNYNLARDADTIIELFLIHTSPHLKTLIEKLSTPFPEWQATIYEDMDQKSHHELGVDVNVGALVVVRPDGYVGLVTGLEGVERVEKYLAGVFGR